MKNIQKEKEGTVWRQTLFFLHNQTLKRVIDE
jgi:hypothetical protein